MNARAIRSDRFLRRARAAAAFSVLEVLVGLALSSMTLTIMARSFSLLSHVSHDYNLKTIAALEAQSVIDMMTPDIRMIGNGVPFHQANFLIAQENLTDNSVTQPILTDGTSESQIRFRLNETGETYIVTSDFNPGSSATVSLTSVAKITEGDQVFITNSTVAEDDGLWGIVDAVNAVDKTVTFRSGTQYSPGAIFVKGSLLEVVPVITYSSTADFGGITRDDGYGPLVLTPSGQFTLTYLNNAGSPITPPLVASAAEPFPVNAIQNVRFVRIQVQVKSRSPLSTGEYYVATATQQVGIRNLNYNY